MTPDDKGGGARGYKRSWKNLLINKRYQLRFTLFMVGLSAVLMAALGWWVMQTASEATNVAIGEVRGDPCPLVPDVTAEQLQKAAAAQPERPITPMRLPEDEPAAGSGAGTASGSAVPDADADLDDARRHRNVTVTMSQIEEVAPLDYWKTVGLHLSCRMNHMRRIEGLRDGKQLILYALIATGTLLIVALAFYGIKTTHKVAGPLFKITLYFQKMRDGRYDKVWPLRKGDQLVAFYDHFRLAHAGVVKLEEADIERIRAVVEAAEAANIAGTSPEIDAALADLRAILERKEKALA